MTAPLLTLGVDGRLANMDQRVGVGNVCRELLRAMAPRAAAQGFRLRVYLDEEPRAGFPIDGDAADLRVLPRRRFWTLRALSAEVRAHPPDVFFSPTLHAPLRCPCPMMLFVHDLAHRGFPDYFTRRQRLDAWLQTTRAARVADHLITNSQATATDVARLLGVPPNRISAAPLAAAPQYHPDIDDDEVDAVCRRLAVPRPYILYVGRIQPRKNIIRLIEAFESVLRRQPSLPHVLVIAGGVGWLYEETCARARQSPWADRILFPGHVKDNQLPALVKGADALALVSLWEGFGLPAVEAMACAVPVIASNRSSLPEVVGDAGLLVDPNQASDIAEALERIMTDESLRQELAAKGPAQAAAFSWDRSAETILAVAASLAAGRASMIK